MIIRLSRIETNPKNNVAKIYTSDIFECDRPD